MNLHFWYNPDFFHPCVSTYKTNKKNSNKKEVTTFKYKIQKSVPTVHYFIQFFKNKQPEVICFIEVCIISNLKHLNLKFSDCNDSVSETLVEPDLQACGCSCSFTWLRSLLCCLLSGPEVSPTRGDSSLAIGVAAAADTSRVSQIFQMFRRPWTVSPDLHLMDSAAMVVEAARILP